MHSVCLKPVYYLFATLPGCQSKGMEETRPDNSQMDAILRGRVRRLQEAPLLAPSRDFYPSGRPPHVAVDGVASARKRPPPLTVDDAVREGTHLTALSVLRNTSVHKASQLTSVPESTIRDSMRQAQLHREREGECSQMNH